MNESAIRELAAQAGLLSDWVDANGRPQRVEVAALCDILSALGCPCGTDRQVNESKERLRDVGARHRPLITARAGTPICLHMRAGKIRAVEITFQSGERRSLHPQQGQDGNLWIEGLRQCGYHRLVVGDAELVLAIAPASCLTIEDLAPGKRLFGLAVQLYALRRPGDGGIGDTTALERFGVSAAQAGADAIALSPTHSLFPADQARFAPYSPSSRLFINPLHADPAILFSEARIAAARDESAASQSERSSLIDWSVSGDAKYRLLRRLFQDFAARELEQHPPPPLAADFHAFVQTGGEQLRQHAVFEALQLKWLNRSDPKWSWTDWPSDWRNPNSQTVIDFAKAESREVGFSMFLQWLADRSFASAQTGLRQAGMRIGIIADLAVGMDRGGSHAWSRQQDLLLDLSVGAPPDKFNTRGQDWGLTAFSPAALIATGYESFLATLRAVMRHAGGIRIDHAMGLMRLWVIPRGASSAEGAYLTYPLDALLNLIALESHLHRAIVIGEDLGTVPPDFRSRMSAAGIAGMDVLWFERDESGFHKPGDWRRNGVAMTTTHDLPTVAGWWTGADLDSLNSLGLLEDIRLHRRQRARDRQALWRAFTAADLVTSPQPRNEKPDSAVDAALGFVAKAASGLALVPVEDILGQVEQPNVPGTVDEHPNWRRRLAEDADRVLESATAKRRLSILRERQA